MSNSELQIAYMVLVVLVAVAWLICAILWRMVEKLEGEVLHIKARMSDCQADINYAVRVSEGRAGQDADCR